MFRFFCPLCGNKLKATQEMVGMAVQCAHCDKVITVPEADSRSTAEITRTKPKPPDGWAKTQEISRSALRNRAEGDGSVNLVDLINEQVDLDSEMDFGSSETSPPPPPPAPPQKVAMPVDMSAEPMPSETRSPEPPQKVATPVEMPSPPEDSEDPDDPEDEGIAPQPPSGHHEPSKYRAGMRLGNFEIGRLLGEGAMGQVFAAKQISMDREVALKILPPEILQRDADAAEQFRNEIKMLAKLDHHNIVTAFEAGEEDGVCFLAMAFINGNSLEELLEDGAVVDTEQALSVTLSVASALDYAWETFNMLHQDVKPANIMLDERGDVKLMDMGIATMATKESSGSTQSFVLGTPHYMSPEQASGRSGLDWRSDQYSLGCTLYRMVTGDVPFPGDDPASVMKDHVSTPLTPAKTKNPELCQEVNDIIKRMLAKTPDKRFQSASELMESLKKAILVVKRQNKGGKSRAKKDGSGPRRKARKRVTMSRGSTSYARRTSGGGGRLLFSLIFIVLAVYFGASLVNKANILAQWGLAFPQGIFLPVFRNDPPQ